MVTAGALLAGGTARWWKEALLASGDTESFRGAGRRSRRTAKASTMILVHLFTCIPSTPFSGVTCKHLPNLTV